MNHTKGPWVTGSYAVNDYNLAIYAWDDAVKIAQVETWNGNLNKESEANTRLISAAPDMLEALKQAFELIGEDLIDNAIDEKYAPLHNEIGMIISKAEGRE